MASSSVTAAPSREKLASDGIFTFVVRLATMVVAATLGVLTARVLGTHGRGIYAAPMVYAGIATAAFSGLSSATSFFLLRRGVGRSVVRLALPAAAAFVAVSAGLSAMLAYIAHAPWAAIPAALSLPGPAALMLATGYATGTHRVRLTTTLATASGAFVLLTMAAAFLFGGRTPAVAIAVWVAAPNIAGLAMLVWMAFDARRLPPGTGELRDFALYALRSGAVGLVTLLNYRADIYIVAVLGTPTMLGMYTLAVSAAETLLATTQVSAIITAPHIGSLEESAAASLAARSVRHNVLVAGVCCALLAIVAPFLVRLLYGPAFLGVVPALRILLVGVLALSLGSPMSTYFTIRLGRPEVPLVLASASALICIVVSLATVPHLGLIGAAIASSAAYIFGQSAAIFYFCAVSGIRPDTMLLPRLSDVRAYARALSALASS